MLFLLVKFNSQPYQSGNFQMLSPKTPTIPSHYRQWDYGNGSPVHLENIILIKLTKFLMDFSQENYVPVSEAEFYSLVWPFKSCANFHISAQYFSLPKE